MPAQDDYDGHGIIVLLELAGDSPDSFRVSIDVGLKIRRDGHKNLVPERAVPQREPGLANSSDAS